MNAVRIIADKPTQVPTAALALFRSCASICVCFGPRAEADVERLQNAMRAVMPLAEALQMVKAKIDMDQAVKSSRRLAITFTSDEVAHISWALSMSQEATKSAEEFA